MPWWGLTLLIVGITAGVVYLGAFAVLFLLAWHAWRRW